LDPALTGDYLELTFKLRRAGVPAEMYLGTGRRFARQLKYADQCGIPFVLLYGPDEKARGTISIKNMSEGMSLTSKVVDRQQWKELRPGQFEVPYSDAVDAVKALCAGAGQSD
jgi:histidyl-tRNA synthetase